MLTNEQADEIYQQAFAALHSVVIDTAATLMGGVDITEDVIRELKKKAAS